MKESILRTRHSARVFKNQEINENIIKEIIADAHVPHLGVIANLGRFILLLVKLLKRYMNLIEIML